MSLRRPVVLLALAAGAAGCDILAPTVCTTEARWGIVVYVKDAVTGAPAEAGATGIARSGPYADSMSIAPGASSGGFIGLATERPGYYQVTVRKAGYRDWTAPTVRVSADRCHVHTVTLTASLQPL